MTTFPNSPRLVKGGIVFHEHIDECSALPLEGRRASGQGRFPGRFWRVEGAKGAGYPSRVSK
jgi:hypothetical protein